MSYYSTLSGKSKKKVLAKHSNHEKREAIGGVTVYKAYDDIINATIGLHFLISFDDDYNACVSVAMPTNILLPRLCNYANKNNQISLKLAEKILDVDIQIPPFKEDLVPHWYFSIYNRYDIGILSPSDDDFEWLTLNDSACCISMKEN